MTAFAAEMDLDPDTIIRASVEIEWLYGSGRRLTAPQIDAVRCVTLPAARQLMLKG